MLRVDNQPTVQALAPGAFTQTSFDTSLYIGGIDNVDILSKEVAVKNSFSGDIQRVSVQSYLIYVYCMRLQWIFFT